MGLRIKAIILSLTCVLVLAACQQEIEPAQLPTIQPFPTATPGITFNGILPTEDRSATGTLLSNPATAAALANIPSPTPNTSACPPPTEDTELEQRPDDPAAITDELLRYLSAGGSIDDLRDSLETEWDVLDEENEIGFLLDDLDVTGDGTPEIILSYSSPAGGGSLLVAGCESRRYLPRYDILTGFDAAPILVTTDDINQDGLIDLVYASEECEELDPDAGEDDEPDCRFRTQIATWQPTVRRMTGLISTGILSDSVPRLQDTDGDAVNEIIVDVEDIGNVDTGPLRTGLQIYDWNGEQYVLSIAQPDPLRYRIQVIHQADRYLAQREIDQAILLYQQSITNDDLQVWLRNENEILETYALYRLLLAYVYNNDERASELIQLIAGIAGELPLYSRMAVAFWESMQANQDISEACIDVLLFIDSEPESVDLLNRYGTRNPTYSARDLCPF